MTTGEIKITDNLDELLNILPPDIAESLKKLKGLSDLIEVVMDLGRLPEARFEDRFTYLRDEYVGKKDIEYVVKRVGKFGDDNRAGIPRTLHRISAIKNRTNDIIGLTMRVGRAVYGTISMISDLMDTEQSILLLGRPGVGKTTMLREMARVLADDFKKRVVIVDTSNEIAGDGDIPHPGIGLARRMQVPNTDLQHEVMIEAVQNHMPQVIVVDEIGTIKEAYAARTIAERGVQLIATAHGNSLSNLLMNPTLSDLVGGIQAVTLSDEEARKRGTQKTVLERKSPPTFDIIIEIQEKDRVAMHRRVDETVDLMLRGIDPCPEIRVRDEKGGYKVIQVESTGSLKQRKIAFEKNGKMSFENNFRQEERNDKHVFNYKSPIPQNKTVKIFPYAVSRNRIEKAAEPLNIKMEVVRLFEDADLVLTLKSQEHKGTKKLREMAGTRVPIFTIRSNTVTQIQKFLREFFNVSDNDINENAASFRDSAFSLSMAEAEKSAIMEAEEGILLALKNSKSVELEPRNSYLRKLQHQLIEKYNLKSRSIGEEPNRRVSIYFE